MEIFENNYTKEFPNLSSIWTLFLQFVAGKSWCKNKMLLEALLIESVIIG